MENGFSLRKPRHEILNRVFRECFPEALEHRPEGGDSICAIFIMIKSKLLGDAAQESIFITRTSGHLKNTGDKGSPTIACERRSDWNTRLAPESLRLLTCLEPHLAWVTGLYPHLPASIQSLP